jgi:hypothetical protein
MRNCERESKLANQVLIFQISKISRSDNDLLKWSQAWAETNRPFHDSRRNPDKMALNNVRDQIAAVGGVGGGGHVFVQAHSQGGLILQRVLDQLSPEEKQMLDVVTYGSAAIIKDPNLNYVRNYINSSDVVPMTDPDRSIRIH